MLQQTTRYWGDGVDGGEWSKRGGEDFSSGVAVSTSAFHLIVCAFHLLQPSAF